MGVPAKLSAGKTEDGNPRAGEIETAFAPIRQALHQGLGKLAGERLEDLRKRDRRLWNACYWRTHDWFVSYFKARLVNGPEDQAEAWDTARGAKQTFLARTYADRDDPFTFACEDLAYLVQRLPEKWECGDVRIGTVPLPKMGKM